MTLKLGQDFIVRVEYHLPKLRNFDQDSTNQSNNNLIHKQLQNLEKKLLHKIYNFSSHLQPTIVNQREKDK